MVAESLGKSYPKKTDNLLILGEDDDMIANDRRIRELQQMLQKAHGAVVKSMDGITEPEIRQVPAPDE